MFRELSALYQLGLRDGESQVPTIPYLLNEWVGKLADEERVVLSSKSNEIQHQLLHRANLNVPSPGYSEVAAGKE